MEKKDESLQELDAMVKKRKWKNRLGVAAVAALVLAISAGSIGSYIKTRQAVPASHSDREMEFVQNQNQNFNSASSMVMAAGTTSVDVKAVAFEVDFLEDTSLYVEEVYLANGDSVKAGDPYIKFTEESIADAREELEAAALSAQLAYRNGQISDGESRLQAKYTYDTAMLEAQFAKQVYDDTIAQLDADYAQSSKTYEEAQQEYNEYLGRVQNQTFYEDYEIASLKKAYEDARELYMERKEYWEVTDDELNSGASAPAGFGGMERQAQQSERKWIVKTMSLLEQEAEKAEEEYNTALEEYEAEIASAELTLQKLQNQLETAREDFTDAEVSYQKQSLSAKTVYETAVAKGKTAQEDYDTQLASLKDSLDRLEDAKEEADSNLALFEALVGDGYLRTEENGTVLMLMAEEGQALTGGSMVFAYSNPEQISVSVSVSQEEIAKLYVGQTASVTITDRGSYSGVIETINPISSSNSRTSVSYTVTVNLQGDVSGIDANLTANVLFGGDGDRTKAPVETILDGEENAHGQPADTDKKTHGTQD